MDDEVAELVARFESGWPDCCSVEAFVDKEKLSVLSYKLIVHLVHCEIELARRDGNAINLDSYSKRFPSLSREVLDDLIRLPGLPHERPVRVEEESKP